MSELSLETQGSGSEVKQILKDPNLLNRFVSDTEKLGHCGEERNKKLLLLACVSCKRPKPISIICQGESASGKSTAVNAVLSCCPENDVIDITEVSSKALFNLSSISLQHKIIVIHEREGVGGADYSIRSLQSERRLKRLVSKHSEKKGWEAIMQEVQGPAAFIQTTTTTQNERNAENESRVFAIFSDDSKELTDRVFEAQNSEYDPEVRSSEEGRNQIKEHWKGVMASLKPIPVKIPFVNDITFPNHPVRVRRDRSRFLTLIELSAHLYQYQRSVKELGGEQFIFASIEDYRTAYDNFLPVLGSNLTGVGPKAEGLWKRLLDEGQSRFSFSQATELMEWDRKTIRKYIKEGCDAGLFEPEGEIKQGMTACFRALRHPKHKTMDLLTTEELQAIIMKKSTSPRPDGQSDG